MSSSEAGPHVPVLIGPLVAAVAPVGGTWLDGTFGAGGYTRALLEAGAARVIAVDRDPDVLAAARDWAARDGRIDLIESTFGRLDECTDTPLEGVVLDLGVSSMQIDRPERGFSFLREGPLDMRMGGQGPSAADLVNEAGERQLADILFQYGEERASRRIARKIVARRPIRTTTELAGIVESCLPRAKPGQSHPATRTFQALRIAVNDELGELARALEAAERALAPGGWLAVVSFHSVEDRIVKRFLQLRSSPPGGSRHAPEHDPGPPRFERVGKPIAPDAAELAANPRSRSARLRLGRRTAAAAGRVDRSALGLPALALEAS